MAANPKLDLAHGNVSPALADSYKGLTEMELLDYCVLKQFSVALIFEGHLVGWVIVGLCFVSLGFSEKALPLLPRFTCWF